MSSISLCITAYNKDYHLIYNLLEEFSKQTAAPSEIIFYTSGIDRVQNIPNNISIANSLVPIYSIINQKLTIQSIARNICAKIASSDIIIFFDVDDIPHPQKIEVTSYLFDQYNPDFFVHNYYHFNQKQNNNGFNDFIDMTNIEVYKNLSVDPIGTNISCYDYPIHHAHVAVKKSVFEKVRFNESLAYYRKEDGKFCQDLILNGYTGVYSPIPLVNYLSIPKSENYQQ